MLHNKGFMALVMILSCGNISAGQIDSQSLAIPRGLAGIKVYNDEGGFLVQDHNKLHIVQPCYMDKELRGISNEKLARLLTAGAYIKVDKNSKDQYELKMNGRVKGGGVVMGKIGFWVTKIGGTAGVLIACAFHPGHVAELPHMLEAVDAAAHAVEVVATVTPGP